MAGNSTLEDAAGDVSGIATRAGTLILMQCFIIPGNSIILLAISTFKKRSVSDILIGCLALIDLLNGIGPVNISIAMYLSHPKGFNGIPGIEWLCLLYTWMSCLLRLMACFTATLMSMDRYIAIVIPFQYRTKIVPKVAYLVLTVLFIFSIGVALLPVLGAARINIFSPMCSFAFTGPFAIFIAVLGYIQILIVIMCYVAVILEINAFLSRQTLLKANQLRASFASKSRQSSKRDNTCTDAAQSGRCNLNSPVGKQQPPAVRNPPFVRKYRSQSLMPHDQTAIVQERQLISHGERSQSWTPFTVSKGSLSHITVNKVTRSTSLSPNIRKPSFVFSRDNCLQNDTICENIYDSKREEELQEAQIQSSLRDFKRNHATWKQSRKLAVVMGVVVVLFYISWLPIVAIITASLMSKSTTQAMHFAAARMSLISSMLNFLVYGGMLKQYRLAYKAIVKKMFGCGEQTSNRQTTSKANTKPSRRRQQTPNSDKEGEHINERMKRVRFKRTINAIAPLAVFSPENPNS